MKFSRRRFMASGFPLMAIPTLGVFQSKAWASNSGREEDTAKSLESTKGSMESVRKGIEWLKRTEGRKGGHGTDIGQPDDIGCSAMDLRCWRTGARPVKAPTNSISSGSLTI